MKVQRIVANVASDDLEAVRAFYADVLGLDVLMDLGFFVTLGTQATARVQIGLGREGGSNTPVPDISVEVDDLDVALDRVRDAGVPIEYGPADESWGVRRFYVRDPAGTLVNILEHR